MTVNISVQTDDISILCADSQRTFAERWEFEGVRKLTSIENENYALVVCTAGYAETGQFGLDAVNNIETDNLSEHINALHHILKTEFSRKRTEELEKSKRWLNDEKELRSIGSDSSFAEYLADCVSNEHKRNCRQYWTTLYFHAVDKASKERIIGELTPQEFTRLALPCSCCGSGAEGAQKYLDKNIPDKNVSMSKEELLYHVLAAYAPSTEYMGVGGIPLFAICSEGTITAYDDTEGCISANLVNASLAGILPKEKVISALGKIVSKKPIKPVLDKLLEEYGDQLGVTADGLSTIPIPARAWEYRAKRVLDE